MHPNGPDLNAKTIGTREFEKFNSRLDICHFIQKHFSRLKVVFKLAYSNCNYSGYCRQGVAVGKEQELLRALRLLRKQDIQKTISTLSM